MLLFFRSCQESVNGLCVNSKVNRLTCENRHAIFRWIDGETVRQQAVAAQSNLSLIDSSENYANRQVFKKCH